MAAIQDRVAEQIAKMEQITKSALQVLPHGLPINASQKSDNSLKNLLNIA